VNWRDVQTTGPSQFSILLLSDLLAN
jgi:hypothetical protein